ncbi:MAG: TonB family protein [Polyangiaceae bacterium]|nr:TonB family protein [Polyangiaceae bacterium]
MDAAAKLASTRPMHLSGFAMVCLSVTSLCIGCGPEPVAKQPSPDASANGTGAIASTAPASSNESAAPPSMASASPSASAGTTVSDTQPLVGSLSSAEIQKAINDNIQAFDACYTLGADKQGKLEGTVTIKATVGPLGTVKDASVLKSTMKNSKVDACVATAFKKVTFPHPKGGVAIITYPMTFGGEVVVKKP